MKYEVSFQCANTILGFRLDIGRTVRTPSGNELRWNTGKEI